MTNVTEPAEPKEKGDVNVRYAPEGPVSRHSYNRTCRELNYRMLHMAFIVECFFRWAGLIT